MGLKRVCVHPLTLLDDCAFKDNVDMCVGAVGCAQENVGVCVPEWVNGCTCACVCVRDLFKN